MIKSAVLKASLDYLNSVTVRCVSGLYGAVNFSGNWTRGQYRSRLKSSVVLYLLVFVNWPKNQLFYFLWKRILPNKQTILWSVPITSQFSSPRELCIKLLAFSHNVFNMYNNSYPLPFFYFLFIFQYNKIKGTEWGQTRRILKIIIIKL